MGPLHPAPSYRSVSDGTRAGQSPGSDRVQPQLVPPPLPSRFPPQMCVLVLRNKLQRAPRGDSTHRVPSLVWMTCSVMVSPITCLWGPCLLTVPIVTTVGTLLCCFTLQQGEMWAQTSFCCRWQCWRAGEVMVACEYPCCLFSPLRGVSKERWVPRKGCVPKEGRVPKEGQVPKVGAATSLHPHASQFQRHISRTKYRFNCVFFLLSWAASFHRRSVWGRWQRQGGEGRNELRDMKSAAEIGCSATPLAAESKGGKWPSHSQ